MASSTKTPVMVLQEHATQKGIPFPQYNIVHAKEGTHDNEFHYEVFVGGIRALGYGRSKQIAKHQAAQKALELLQEAGHFEFGETTIKAPKSEINTSTEKSTVNSHIALLNEMCCEYKMPAPRYTELSDIGPPHCKQFTYQCQMSTIMTRGTAGTKKQAKQIAAKQMIERIGLSNFPIPQENDQELESITDDAACAKYVEIYNFSKPNMALEVVNYGNAIRDILQEKEVTFKELEPYFSGPKTEENLKNLLDKLELSFMISEFDEEPVKHYVLKLNTEAPFVILKKADSCEEAKEKLIGETFENLEIMLKS